jgi:hypothetical protein
MAFVRRNVSRAAMPRQSAEMQNGQLANSCRYHIDETPTLWFVCNLANRVRSGAGVPNQQLEPGSLAAHQNVVALCHAEGIT